MFTVIYSFKIKKDKVAIFEQAWFDMTTLIYKHQNSLGSRLHKQNNTEYIAYAQWLDKNSWMNSRKINDDGYLSDIKNIMNESCEKIEVLFELDVVKDMLKTSLFLDPK